jgi:hypothetical protein
MSDCNKILEFFDEFSLKPLILNITEIRQVVATPMYFDRLTDVRGAADGISRDYAKMPKMIPSLDCL